MKKISLILLSAFLFQSAISQSPNFSGAWKLNSTKSSFASTDPAKSAAATITIRQATDSILLQRTFAAGGDPTDELYSLDGKVFMLDIPTGGQVSRKFSAVVMNPITKEFTVSATYRMNDDGEVPEWASARSETYQLSGDGKTLQVKRINILPGKTEITTAVYDKM